MRPQREPNKHKPTLTAARAADAVDETIPLIGTVVTRPVRVGPWDVDRDTALSTPARTPKGVRRRQKLTQVALMLRAQEWSVPDIAAKLGVSVATVTGWFATHRREMSTEDIDAMLDSIAVPLATENLIHGLIAGDKDYTIATLSGRGRFRKHSEGEGKPATQLPELRIVFDTGNSTHEPKPVMGGKVLGSIAVPKSIEVKAAEAAAAQEVAHVGQLQIPRATPPAASADGRGEVPADGIRYPGGEYGAVAPARTFDEEAGD